MAKIDKTSLGDRRDFWNVPCNPILGYRYNQHALSESSRRINENFFKDTIETKWM